MTVDEYDVAPCKCRQCHAVRFVEMIASLDLPENLELRRSMTLNKLVEEAKLVGALIQ